MIRLLKAGDTDTLLSASRANEIIEACNELLGMRVDAPLILQKGDQEWILSIDPNALGSPDGFVGKGGLFPNGTQSFSVSCPAGTTGGPLTATVTAGTIYAKTQAIANDNARLAAVAMAFTGLTCVVGIVIDGEILCLKLLSDQTYMIAGNFQTVYGTVRIGMARLSQNFNLLPGAWKFDQSSISSGINPISAIDLNYNDPTLGDYCLAVGFFSQVDLLPNSNISFTSPEGGVQGGYLAPNFVPASLTLSGTSPLFVYVFETSTGAWRHVVIGPITAYNGVSRAGAFDISTTGADTGLFIPSGWSVVAGVGVGMLNDNSISVSGGVYIWNVTRTASAVANTMIYANDSGVINAGWVLDTKINGGPSYPFGACIFGQGTASPYLVICGLSTVNITTPTAYTRASLLKISLTSGAYIGWPGEGIGFDGDCVCLAGIGSSIICVGRFTKYDGVACGPYICKINGLTGALDLSFTAYANDRINQVLIDSGGNINICGNFTGVNGVARSRIARLDSSGNLL